MIKSFLAFLGGEPGEEKPMLLLLGMGFFMGIFLATYQIGSETLFLDVLGEEYLDKAFFCAGAAGIVSTVLFVFLQKRIKYSSLIITNLFLIFAFMAVMRWAFELTEYDQDAAGFHVLPFILFVMIGPITAITLLGFWGIFGRIFDLRASKRIIGGIDTGALTATIIAFFSIPFITRLPFIDSTYDLLFVSAISSFGVFFFTIWIVKDFNVNKATKVKHGAEKPKEVNFFDLLKDPYLRLLSLFLIFSMGASVFVDYTFYSATEIMYPDEQELTNFLSFFSGTVMIMSFLIQSFVNDIIIGKFGIKVALMTMPLILILFTLGGIVSGHIFGYEIKNEEFILFFMFIACGKAFTAALKDALESPAFKLFFLPIDIKIRFDIQTRIEGVVNEIATLVAGAAQIALGLLIWFKLIHFSYFIVVLACVVVYLSGKLFEQYKITLKKTLNEQKEALGVEGTRNEESTLNVIKREIASKDVDRALGGLRIMERLDPIQFEFALLDLLNSRFAPLRKYAYEKLEEYLVFEALDIIKKDFKTEGDERVLESANSCIKILEEAASFDLNDISIRAFIRSTESQDRIKGARLLVKSTEDKYLAYVNELLRDINPKVRVAAMITAGKIKRPELWPGLVENLHLATYGNPAMSALTNGGEAAFHIIDSAFYKTGQYKPTMIRVVQLLGRIGGKSAIDLLWKKIDFPDKKVVSELLLALSYIGFKARDFQAARIKIAIESSISDIGWNIKALLDIPQEDYLDIMIREAIQQEDVVNYENIFMLLGMIYDPQNVKLVRDNIQDGTEDGITFAVEMMDIFVEEELKPKLIPIMDEMKVEDRLGHLENHFPPEDFESYYDLLLQIVNRDYNRINRYTKALALYKIQLIEEAKVSPDLIANLFNPDYLLLETAAYTIYKIDEEAYHTHTKRLRPGIKKELDKAIVPPVFKGEDEDYHQKLLLIERVLLLKEVEEFNTVEGQLITNIAEELTEVQFLKGTTIVDQGDNGNTPLYIIIDGVVEIHREGEKVEERSRGDLIAQEYILESNYFEYNAIVQNKCKLLVLRKEELQDLMSKHLEIVEAYFKILNRTEDVEEEIEIADILINI
ncbi:MAG: cyclic nucleotide-binding domain-containing protein [Cyclobacteriaceae bacterium]